MSAPLLRPNLADDHDDIGCLHGPTWAQFEAILEARGERAAPRITYLEGELEPMNPGPSHERIKTVIARLLELWALECDVVIEGVGSWTLRREDKARGVEPDECYFVGRTDGDAPDLAIEVVWSHGSIDKLGVYGPLGVRELWIWEEGRVKIHALRGERVRGGGAERGAPDARPGGDAPPRRPARAGRLGARVAQGAGRPSTGGGVGRGDGPRRDLVRPAAEVIRLPDLRRCRDDHRAGVT